MQKDMEISCDEAVIKQMPFEERKAYSALLLQMAAAKSQPSLHQWQRLALILLKKGFCIL